MRALFLSPHPDDIAWSLGATVSRLREAGVELHTATFFGSTRYAPGHASHGSVSASQVRRAEERAWAELTAVRLWSFGLPDASLRGYSDETEMGPTPDTGTVRAVRLRLLRAIRSVRPDLLFAPLAAGGHVDHSAVRLAMSSVRTEAAIFWYEDLPYAAENTVQCTGHLVPLDTREHWSCKESAVRCFPSQRPESVLPILDAHGERVWASTAAAAENLMALLSASPNGRRTGTV